MICLPIALLVACAQGTVPAGDVGDLGFGGDDGNDPTNVAPSNTPDPDIGNPPNSNMMNGICIVNETTCLDEATLGTCRPDQMGYDSSPCPDGQGCTNGGCTSEPICTPGALECLNDNTVLRCRANGEGYIQMTCEEGLNCGEGVCTDKLPSGAGCTTDDECASNNCRCGNGTDDGCPDTLGGGICANMGCAADGCGMGGHCLASGQAPTGAADYDHCVRACSDMNPCPTGSKCVAVPVHTGGGVEFRDSCYFTGVGGFGDDCTDAAQCLSGDCLTGYFDNGFCSRRCDLDGFCSEGSACAELIAGQFWCTLTCGDGSVTGTDPCPLDEPVERFDVTCKNLALDDGDVARVCAAP